MSAATERFERSGERGVVRPVEPGLAHVRDVEQPGLRAGMGVLGQNAVAILDRHVVAGEGREARAIFAVQGVKRSELLKPT